MQVESEFEKKAVYIVDRDGLSEIWHFMHDKFGEMGPVTAELNCADEVTRSSDRWEEVFDYGNPASRRIQKLTLSAGNLFEGRAMRLELYERPVLNRSAAVTIRCEEDEILAMRTSVEEMLDGMRHGLLSRVSGRWQWPCIALLVAGLAWMIAIGVNSETAWPAVWQALYICGTIVGGLIIYTLVFSAHELENRFLPRVHFNLGQGAKRYENWMKSWKMISGACALALTLLVAFVSYFL